MFSKQAVPVKCDAAGRSPNVALVNRDRIRYSERHQQETQHTTQHCYHYESHTNHYGSRSRGTGRSMRAIARRQPFGFREKGAARGSAASQPRNARTTSYRRLSKNSTHGAGLRHSRSGPLLGRRCLERRIVRRGEVRWYRFAAPDKRRPVVVLSRDSIMASLNTVTVAPVSSRIREALIKSELREQNKTTLLFCDNEKFQGGNFSENTQRHSK